MVTSFGPTGGIIASGGWSVPSATYYSIDVDKPVPVMYTNDPKLTEWGLAKNGEPVIMKTQEDPLNIFSEGGVINYPTTYTFIDSTGPEAYINVTSSSTSVAAWDELQEKLRRRSY